MNQYARPIVRTGARLGLGLAFSLGFFLRDLMEPKSRVRDELSLVYKRVQGMLSSPKAEKTDGDSEPSEPNEPNE